MTRLFLSYGVTVIAAVLVVTVMMVMKVTLFKSDKVISDARKKGRTAEAVLVRSTVIAGEPGVGDVSRRRTHWAATYEYQVGGKTYHYRRAFFEVPPQTLTLYYSGSDPRKAYAEGEKAAGTAPWIYFLIIAAVFLFCFRILFR